MITQTVTRSTEADIEPPILYARLTDAFLLPSWAPVFADKVERAGDATFQITKDKDSFAMELVTNEAASTVDYLRPMQNGKKGGAYLRVTPRPLGGSTVVMTVPVGPNSTPDQVAVVLEEELKALIELTAG